MLKTLARFALLRVLPRRIVPVVAVVETVLFLRSIRNRSRVRVNSPAESRTAPPTADRLASDHHETSGPQSPASDPI